MGYTTKFTGQFAITPPLQHAHWVYLQAFAEVRHMLRSAVLAERLPDEARIAVGLPIGEEGGYYVASDNEDESVVAANQPPVGQPGLFCQWVPNEQGTALVWDQEEKFYAYVAWLKYLIEHFLAP